MFVDFYPHQDKPDLCIWWPHAEYPLTHWPLGKCGSNFKSISFKLIIQNSCREITVKWIPQNLTNEKSTLVQVMACCHQATSHYLSHCWPRSMLPYGITRPQWVVMISFAMSWHGMIFTSLFWPKAFIYIQHSSFSELKSTRQPNIIRGVSYMKCALLSHRMYEWM